MATTNVLREVGLEPSPANPPPAVPTLRAEPRRARVTEATPTVEAPPQKPQRKPVRRKSGLGLILSAVMFIVLPIIAAAWFYTVVATNQYISEFKLSIRGPERSNDGSAGLAGSSAIGPTVFDAFIVTELINSRQMVSDVGKHLDLRQILASPKGDFFYRLKLPATQEDLVEHWKKIVTANFDMLTGIVTVSVRTFSPEESLQVAGAIAKAADEAVFKMSERARQDLVRFADEDVKRAEGVLDRKRVALRDYRVKEQIIDATRTAASSSDLAGQLRAQRSQILQEIASGRAQGLIDTAPQLQALRSRLNALDSEIARQGRTIGEGSRSASELSPTVLAQFDSLMADMQIAEKVYGAALENRQRAQAAADRRTSYVTLFVEPTLPDASLFPSRVNAVILVALLAATGWFLGLLIISSVRDHLL
jgi:capsular polysaccharide transport system permease protein